MENYNAVYTQLINSMVKIIKIQKIQAKELIKLMACIEGKRGNEIRKLYISIARTRSNINKQHIEFIKIDKRLKAIESSMIRINNRCLFGNYITNFNLNSI